MPFFLLMLLCEPCSEWSCLLLTSGHSSVLFSSTWWTLSFKDSAFLKQGSLLLPLSPTLLPRPHFCRQYLCFSVSVPLLPVILQCLQCLKCGSAGLQWDLCVFLAEALIQNSAFPDATGVILGHLFDASVSLNRSAIHLSICYIE